MSSLSRTTPNLRENLETCGNIFKEQLITNIVGRDTLNSSSVRYNPYPLKWEAVTSSCYPTMKTAWNALRNITSTRMSRFCYNKNTARKKMKTDRTNRKKTHLIKSLYKIDEYAIELASEKRASNWFHAVELTWFNFNLNKSEVRDGIYLRYGREPTNTPLTSASGANFYLTHARHCAHGNFTHIYNNEIRDAFANLMIEFCHDVEVEP